MPIELEGKVYRQNKAFYDGILTNVKLARPDEEITASAILISGCLDNQYSQDGPFNSLFTAHLLRVWHDGKFSGSIQEIPPEIDETSCLLSKPRIIF